MHDVNSSNFARIAYVRMTWSLMKLSVLLSIIDRRSVLFARRARRCWAFFCSMLLCSPWRRSPIIYCLSPYGSAPNWPFFRVLNFARKERQEWELRHSGFLGLKYVFAVRQDLVSRSLENLLPALIRGLKDSCVFSFETSLTFRV